VEFIETTGFSSIREIYFDDSQFHMLQLFLYWITKNHQILFLTAYAKNEASDLSRDAIKAMREIVKDL